MAANEDVPYIVGDHAILEDKPPVDVDQPNKPILTELLEEIEADIAYNQSFEAIDIPANATPEQKIAAFDDMAIHKGLAIYLGKYKVMIENKIKELK